MSNSSLDAFFDNPEAKNVSNQVDAAPSTNSMAKQVNVPGTYIMKVRSFVMKKKNETTIKPFPNVVISESPKTKGSLQLHINLEVVDGTEAVPAGSNLFYTLTMVQAPEATEEKKMNTIRFMKPVLCALVGSDKWNFDKKFMNEYLTIDYDPASLKITRDHKMKNTLCCVVEEYIGQNGQPACRIKSIRAAAAGEKSSSVKVKPVEQATLDLGKTADEIKAGQGQVTVEASELDYDPSMDQSPGFQVEDA